MNATPEELYAFAEALRDAAEKIELAGVRQLSRYEEICLRQMFLDMYRWKHDILGGPRFPDSPADSPFFLAENTPIEEESHACAES